MDEDFAKTIQPFDPISIINPVNDLETELPCTSTNTKPTHVKRKYITIK